MRILRVVLAVVAGVGLCTSVCAATLTVPHVDNAPTVDGSLDDVCWQQAAVTEDFRVLGTDDPAPAQTEARVCATDEMLYVGFRCLEPDGEIVAQKTGHTSPSREDSVEVFLGPRQGEPMYAHFMLGAGGAFFEQKVEGQERDRVWRAPWVQAASRVEGGWTAELGIPLYVLGTGPIGQAPLALNLTRNRTTEQGASYYTWADLKRSFHDPEYFGALSGLAGQEVAPTFAPMMARATALNYEMSEEGFAYAVRVELVNSGGKAGAATLRLMDELEGGPAQERLRTVDLTPAVQTVRWQVPVAELGRRSARVQVQDAVPDAWTEVAGAEDLQIIKVYTDRSYYTDEADARLVCAAVFTQAHAREEGFALFAEVTRRGGEAVHQGTFAQPGRRAMHTVPLENLAPGTYTATVALRDGAGAEVAQAECDLIKRPPGPSTTVKFDHIDNQLLVDGEPFFPVGYMYTGGVWTEETMKKLSDGGVNCLVRWSGVIGGGPRTEEGYAQLAAETAIATRHGIKTFLPLAAFGPRVNYGMSMDEFAGHMDTLMEALPGALRRYRDLDGVIGYYGLDEPGTAWYGFARRLYLTFQQGDPYRILYGSSWRDWEPEAYGLYDLLGRHSYWMPYIDGPNKLARGCVAMRELATRFHKPFVATPQGCWREETRKITPHEMRMSYYVPLIQGAKALIIFTYDDDIHPAEWKAATEIFSEVNALTPLLLKEGPPQNVTCNLAAEPGEASLPPGPAAAQTDFRPVMQESTKVQMPAVQVLVKNHPDGGEVILAANSANRPREVQYTLSSLTADSRVVNFFDLEKTYERVGAQGFSDRLEGWGVRVYRTLNTDRAPDEAVRMAVNVVDQGPLGPEPAPREQGKNLLYNASFEQCTYFGRLDYWMVENYTSDLDQRMELYEQVDLEDAYHGDKAGRAGWYADRPPQRETFRNLAQRGELDFGQNYVFSVYLKADREDVPATLMLVDLSRIGQVAPPQFQDVTVGTQWQRYALRAPLKDRGFDGKKPFEVGVRVNTRANILVDAAQLEMGTEATAFEVDGYRAMDLGPEYSREALLGERDE